ncbi:MAG: UDP-N-acetylglucosamine 1-carboxyvinyltransferase [Gammaproteobacteria bacterium]|nr:UDP-N-acetylglucosamine 1-carboxyvinyltransferase [Gammaproteobacteria bacterium]
MTDKLVIHGGKPLMGTIPVSGAKNAALKILAASLLANEPVRIGNLPHLHDLTTMLELLGELGCEITFHDNLVAEINPTTVHNLVVPYDLVKAMRASIVVLGPLLAKYKQVSVALPGGCAIGSRPIDIHLDGLRTMGAEIEVTEGFVKARVNGRLKGTDVTMHTVTVTGTENLMMAATLAEGVTILHNAAAEPEIVDLANFLRKMGAKISGDGTTRIMIEGVESLHGASYNVMPDRIEAGTYLVAAAMTKGCVTLKNVDIDSMSNILLKLEEAGALVSTTSTSITVDMRNRELLAVNIDTAPYPGFATDMQAQFLALNTIATGVSEITENIFENRFMHVPELQRLGADIRIKGNKAIVVGVSKLVGAPVMARDLRASASLVLAGLVAEGETVLEGVHHMDRGYEYLEEKFTRLGANIHRVQDSK